MDVAGVQKRAKKQSAKRATLLNIDRDGSACYQQVMHNEKLWCKNNIRL